jgi:integrase
MEILGAMRKLAPGNPNPGAPVFPGSKEAKPLSDMAFLMLLRRMGRDDLTAHGFRSSFRDWVSETTRYPSEVAEMALAHAVGNAVEAAYRRGDLFERRRRLMAEWANYCGSLRSGTQNGVVVLRKQA